MDLHGTLSNRGLLQPATRYGFATNLGVRAHDFGRLPADELARRIAAHGFDSVQLALNKALAGPDLNPGDLNASLARETAAAFQAHGVSIEVLGCYINPLHPDLKARRRSFGWFAEHLRYARDFKCGLVALETGSVNADYSPHPDNDREPAFGQLLEGLVGIVKIAELFDVKVGVEAVVGHVVSTPHKLKRLLQTTGSDHLCVVFDPVNLLSAANCHEQDRIMDEAIELVGEHIAVLHAKDFVIKGSEFRFVPAGQGMLEYGRLIRKLAGIGWSGPILLEGVDERCAGSSLDFLEAKIKEVCDE